MNIITDYDREVYEKELRDFLPKKIIDCHTHVCLDEFYTGGEILRGAAWWFNVGYQYTCEDLIEFYRDFFPGKTVTPVIFSNLSNTDISRSNSYVSEQGKKHGFPRLFATHPDMPAEELEAAFDAGFAGIKPYLCFAPRYIPENEIRIFDFLTREHLAAANRRKTIVMLHIPRGGRLRDPVNIEQLLEIEEKYPDAKIIVAHVGRAYAPEDIGDAFERLSVTKRMMFDFSANTLEEAIRGAIKTFGPKRVMFGSDLSIAVMRMRRISEEGNYINIVPPGLYGDLTGVAHMRESSPDERLTLFIYEIIRSAKRAMEGCSAEDARDVFYNNARELFGL